LLECKSLKEQTLKLFYGKFISTKKQFKKCKNAKEKILQKIMECKASNPKMFWKLLNELRNKDKNNSNPIKLFLKTTQHSHQR
jgi:hypothetical protein